MCLCDYIYGTHLCSAVCDGCALFVVVGFTGFQTGSGQTGVFTEGQRIPYSLPCLGLSAHVLPHVATFCHMLPYVAICCHSFPWKLTMGNRGTSVTTPFVLTLFGSCQHTGGRSRGGCDRCVSSNEAFHWFGLWVIDIDTVLLWLFQHDHLCVVPRNRAAGRPGEGEEEYSRLHYSILYYTRLLHYIV